MYMLNMVIILIVMYCNVVTAIDKIPTYLLRFNKYLRHKLCSQWAKHLSHSLMVQAKQNVPLEHNNDAPGVTFELNAQLDLSRQAMTKSLSLL